MIGSGTYVIEGMGNMMYVMIYVTEGMGSMTWAAGIQVSRRKMELGWRRKNKINTQICLVIEPFFRTASFFFLIYPKLLFITGVDQVMEAPSP